MLSSHRAVYFANQTVRRGTRFLLSVSFILIPMLSAPTAWSQTCNSTVNQTVKICAPANGSTVASPVQYSAGALDTTHPITGMVLYVDSVKKASSTSAHLTAALSSPSRQTHHCDSCLELYWI